MKQLLLCALFFWSAATWSMEERDETPATHLLINARTLRPDEGQNGPPPSYRQATHPPQPKKDVLLVGTTVTLFLTGGSSLYSMIHSSTASSPEEAHHLNVLAAITGVVFFLQLGMVSCFCFFR